MIPGLASFAVNPGRVGGPGPGGEKRGAWSGRKSVWRWPRGESPVAAGGKGKKSHGEGEEAQGEGERERKEGMEYVW